MKISAPKKQALDNAIHDAVSELRIKLIKNETPANRAAHQQLHGDLAAMQDAINNGVTDVLGLECSQ